MPRPNRGRVQVCTRFDPEDIAYLRREAEERGIDVAETLRRFVAAQRLATVPGLTPPRGGHPGTAPVEHMPKATTAPVTGARPSHPFTAQSGNPLRCSVCGQRKAAH